MSEAEIRDAYDLALRSADRQVARWKERALPLRPQHVDSLVTVSAIPREPAPDILDMRRLELDALRPPDFIQKPEPERPRWRMPVALARRPPPSRSPPDSSRPAVGPLLSGRPTVASFASAGRWAFSESSGGLSGASPLPCETRSRRRAVTSSSPGVRRGARSDRETRA